MYKNKHRFAICVYVWGRFTHTTGSQLQIIIFCFIYFVRLFARRWRRRRRWQAWVVEKQKSMINTPVALNNKYFVGDSSFCFSVSFVRDVVFRISLTIHINFNGAKKRKEKQLVLQKWSHKKCCAHRMHSPVHYSLSHTWMECKNKKNHSSANLRATWKPYSSLFAVAWKMMKYNIFIINWLKIV